MSPQLVMTSLLKRLLLSALILDSLDGGARPPEPEYEQLYWREVPGLDIAWIRSLSPTARNKHLEYCLEIPGGSHV